MLTYEQALKRIVREVPKPQATVLRLERALGLVLARPIVATVDLPRFDNSAVDGYAIRTTDLPEQMNGSAPAWRVIGESQAGHPFHGAVQTGQAVRIFTGAPVPPGANAVVMQEHVKRSKHGLIIPRWPRLGQHIRRRGEDVRRGTRVLKSGTRLRPQEIGLLAALGYAEVPVYRHPVVAILGTGDEVRPPGVRLKPGQIYDSNGSLLQALAQRAGVQVTRLGTAGDAMRSLMAKVRRGLACDVLLIAGGVSVGETDLVKDALQRSGVHCIFWRVNIKPGMPLCFGRRGRTLVFGLPGNPVSVFVTFEELVKPALHRLMGRTWRDPYTIPATLAQDLKISQTRRTHFMRVRCGSNDRRVLAQPVDGQGSHHLRSLVEADGWIRLDATQRHWPAGTRVLVKPETP